MTKENIWIFHHYATPPVMNGMTRPYNFGIQLKEYGYNVTVFAASYLHAASENLIKDKENLYIRKDEDDIPFIFINTPSYTGNGVKRVMNMVSYYRNLFKVTKEYENKNSKPDLIIASSPHPLAMVAGIKIAKKLNIPCLCEIRDFWPEVFFMNNTIKENSIAGKILLKGEHWIYKRADGIIFLKEGDINYLTDKKWDTNQGGDVDLGKCYYINNGVDIENFKEEKDKYVLDDPDLNSDKFNIVYAGAIRQVNDVGNMLDTAILLKEDKDIQFLIYGEGNELEDLRQRVIDEDIDNVKLKGYVDKKYIPYVLSKSSVNILNYSQEKYNWSRGNSSNKLFEYMASGKPIISTVKMGYCPLERYKCGLSLERNTPKNFAKVIKDIYKMSEEEYNQIRENARIGDKDFDYKKLTKDLINVMKPYIRRNEND